MCTVFQHLICQHGSVLPASVAQLDAHATSDQEVADSIPVGSATFFCGDLIMKYFLRSFSPFH